MNNIYEHLEIPENSRTVSITKEEGEFLYNFIKDKNIKKTLEVGFSYGCSAAHIISATYSKHYVIDPYQDYFDFIGIKNLKKLKLTKYLIHKKDISQIVLPSLLQKRVYFEFAFIDGGHKFDEVFLDFYYLDLIIKNDGYIVLHDLWMQSTQMMVSWIYSNKKNYKVIDIFQSIIIFQKIKNDDRDWYDFNDFTLIWNKIKSSEKQYHQRVKNALNNKPNVPIANKEFIKILKIK